MPMNSVDVQGKAILRNGGLLIDGRDIGEIAKQFAPSDCDTYGDVPLGELRVVILRPDREE